MLKQIEKEYLEKKLQYCNPEKDDFLDSGDDPSEKSLRMAYVVSLISGWDTVLISGPNGVGKNGYAKLIWNESLCEWGEEDKNDTEQVRWQKKACDRFDKKANKIIDREMLNVNCAAFSENLIAAELFGYKKGAFTGADKAHKGKIQIASEKYGCLFLDEVGDLPLSAQAMLLRFFQNGEIQPLGCSEPGTIHEDSGEKNSFRPGGKLNKVKVICATNKNLEEEVKKGNFRLDLFHRINKYHVEVPPLCERPNDCEQNFENYFQKIKKDLMKVNGSAKSWLNGVSIDRKEFGEQNRLHGYQWPGNFRELRNRLNEAFVQKIYDGADDLVIRFGDLFPEGVEVAKMNAMRQNDETDIVDSLAECGFPPLEGGALPEFDLEQCLNNLRVLYVNKAKAQCQGKKSRASMLLKYSNYQIMDRAVRAKKS
ncbi:MAG: sigma 54-interacting transcriptional regulator [Fibrobacter sp.]|nr:sigma 54-interacting transcriptional regulator [Fibrobacter sp.]